MEERYSLTDQIRGYSSSACGNFTEAWRKRRYQALFILAKLNDCESEAAETQVGPKFPVKCQYISLEERTDLYSTYNQFSSGLVKMINGVEVEVFLRAMS